MDACSIADASAHHSPLGAWFKQALVQHSMVQDSDVCLENERRNAVIEIGSWAGASTGILAVDLSMEPHMSWYNPHT
jgi:hypothetical protein